MKKLRFMPRLSQALCAFLVFLAPMIIAQGACMWLYGEAECPKSLQ